MPYGTLSEIWGKLTNLERSEQARQWTEAKSTQAPRAERPGAIRSFTTLSAPPPSQAIGNWFYVRGRNEFPGNHPDYSQLRQIGCTGILTLATDPLLHDGLAMDRANGFLVGVWYLPTGTPAEAVAQLKSLVGNEQLDAVSWDVEFIAKGWPGSEGWNYSEGLAPLAAAAFPSSLFLLTTFPLGINSEGKSDYNYAAWANAGAIIQVQCYGADPATDLFDPVTVVNNVHSNGVPYNRIAVLIAASQLPTAVAPLQQLGVYSISVFTQDGLTPEVVASAAPFRSAVPVSAPVLTAPSTTRAPNSGSAPIVVITPEGDLIEVTRAETPNGIIVLADELPDDGTDGANEYEVDDGLLTYHDLADDEDEIVRTLQETTRCGTVIGFPYSGSHSRATNCGGSGGGPSCNWQSMNAVDVWCPVGTAVLAAEGGTISTRYGYGESSSGGRFAGKRLHIETHGGPIFFYTHCSRLIARPGQAVRPGQIIAYSGSANGVPHLHFAVDERADPRKWQAHLVKCGVFDHGGYPSPTGSGPAQVPAPKAAPKLTPTLGSAWNELSLALTKQVPASINRTAAARRKLHSFLT